MTVTRKEFLTLVAAAAASTAIEPGTLLAAGNGNGFNPGQLQKAVGQTFRVMGRTGRQADLVLQSFVDKPNPKTTQFSLVFTAPGGERLEEGSYTMNAKSLGSMEIFITPTGVANGVPSYRADFNLLPTGK
jgi:hypothetical protein